MEIFRNPNKRKFADAHVGLEGRRWIRYLTLGALIVSFLAFTLAASGQATVFGPNRYTRTSGTPNTFQESFTVSNINSSFTLIVQNGQSNGEDRITDAISSGRIILNGVEVVGRNEFNPQVALIQKTVALRENNTLTVELFSAPESFITISIVRDPIPVLSITSPLNGAVFRTQPITVEGTIDTASAQVTVNGVTATVNGGRFIANNVPLPRDGMNTITAVGTAPGGNTSQASVMVILDTMAPTIVIDSPSNGFITPDNTISISGMVSDVITANPTVFVNDVPATVTNGTFLAMGVPLNMGDNQITATARDGVGNQSTASITVNRADLQGLRLLILSGQAQSGVINSSLPAPLKVQLIDAAGEPVSNREVLFLVSRGDGTIKNSPPPTGQIGQRTLNIITEANGEAAVRFDLGSRTGPGNNRVQASVVGGLSPVEFSATATSGAPDRIAIIPMSNQQTGVVNQPLGMPLACVVLDAAGNPVTGVPVTFQVTEGGGNFGGNPSFVEATGADGVAHALLTLGPEPGTQNNAVAATFQGQTDPPITFVASGRVPGLLGNTTFSGLVLDNGDLPLRNARAVIVGTGRSAVTDATGRFLITNVPPGARLLFIDGSGIVDSQGRIFPDLEFDLNVISGVENSLPMPIYLPPLSTDPQSVATITGPVTTPIILQMPGLPQATLTLLAGTIVSNHSGPASASNPITVRLSRVNNDRVPMPPPNGSVFTLAGTVQPAGTHFSIPARVCSPNTGMSPGAQVDIFSFDHDVGQFLNVGLATVSEDGSTVCSNPGFGITKAGWFGATPPPPPTTEPKNCRVTLTANPNPVPIPQVVGPPISEEVVITATTDPGGKTVTWGGDQGVTPVISGNTLRTRYGTPGEKVVTATCEQSTQSVTVKVVRAMIEINSTPAQDDDITVLNPAQTIQARVTLEGPAATVQLAVTPAGRATLDRSSLNLSSGGSDTVTITPTARSQAVNDVTITVTVSGTQVATEDMTIVNVVFPAIRRSNTPSGMPDRIPPRVDTPINVQLEPNLGTGGQQVTLAILNGSATNGTVTINGNATHNITTTGNVNLRGDTQTAATGGTGGGNAGNLRLVARVRGQDTRQSNGFSVAAIVERFTTEFNADINTGTSVGLRVTNRWRSDSGVLADLDAVERSEVIDVVRADGVFTGVGGSTSGFFDARLGSLNDSHSTPNSILTGNGVRVANQVFIFNDRRTGVTNAVAPDSGFIITRTATLNADGSVTFVTHKVGAANTASGFTATAGTSIPGAGVQNSFRLVGGVVVP